LKVGYNFVRRANFIGLELKVVSFQFSVTPNCDFQKYTVLLAENFNLKTEN